MARLALGVRWMLDTGDHQGGLVRLVWAKPWGENVLVGLCMTSYTRGVAIILRKG